MGRKYETGIIWIGQTSRRHRCHRLNRDDDLELTMSRSERPQAIGFTTIPRAVLSVAYGVVYSVERAMVGDARVRTARSNAWEALCADRDRARRRAELKQVVAELIADPTPPLKTQLSVGSSPRSKASQASLVSTGPAVRD
jgi:hypothetical protein